MCFKLARKLVTDGAILVSKFPEKNLFDDEQ